MALRVLLAYDGSETAAAAVRAAARLFGEAHAVVATVPAAVSARTETVQRAVPTIAADVVEQTVASLETDAHEDAAEIAREGAERARAHGLRAEARTAAPGAPGSSLLELAQELAADVLVCGTRGRSALGRMVLGSTSTRLLHHAELPLLVVPDDAGEPAGAPILAFDGAEPATRAVEAAGRLLPGRSAVVLHVWESPYRYSRTAKALARGPVDDVREIIAVLDQALADVADERTRTGVELATRAGLVAVGETLESEAGIAQAVAAHAREHDAAVIVCGARGLGGVRSALLGSVSSGLVHHADRPTLVVP